MQFASKIIIISTCLLLMTLIFGFIGASGIFKFIVKDATSLRHRNLVRKYYLKLPLSLDFKVYFFNVSNPSDVEVGRTPVLKQIGPYCYDAFKEKIDIVDNEGEDSLAYTPYETYFFNQEKSKDLSQNDYVTILNPLVVGAINFALNGMEPLMPIVLKGMKIIMNNPRSIYITIKVRDIIFDGVTINCTSKDYSARALCPQIRTLLKDLVTEPERDIFVFSFMGTRNGTIPKRFKVLRGIKNSKKLGTLIELNDQKLQSVWSTKKCNRFKGTDGWIFPPFLTKEEGIWSFSADLCRNIQAKFIEDVNFRGIPVRKYYATLGDMSSNPEEKCYCPTPTTCLPRGIMNLNKCMGVPIYATLPHLLDVDPAIRRKVRGMRPKMDKHAVKILFEYITGTPVMAAKRMQFNLPIKSVSKVDFMKTIPEALHPIIWIEESVELTGSLFNMIYAIIFFLKIMAVVKYCCLGISIVGLAIGGFQYYKNKKTPEITPIHSAHSPASGSEVDLLSKGSSAKYEPTVVSHVMSGHEFDKF